MRGFTLCLMAFIFGASVAQAKVRLCPNEQNVVSNALPGEWKADLTLFDRLAATEPNLKNAEVTFVKDDKVADKFPKLKGKCAFVAGVLTLKNFKPNETFTFPAVVIEMNGNMTLVYQEQENHADGSPDLETSIVNIARTEGNKNDILFLGNDFNEGDSLPFVRK